MWPGGQQVSDIDQWMTAWGNNFLQCNMHKLDQAQNGIDVCINIAVGIFEEKLESMFLTYFRCVELEKGPFQAEFLDLGGQKLKSKWPPLYFNIFNYAVP